MPGERYSPSKPRRQVAHINRALEKDESSVPGVAQEEVLSWMESWGTDRELPPPKPKGS